MIANLLHKADLWITKILSYPGIDEDSLAQKKIYWISSLSVTTMILCLTIVYHILFPQLRIIIYYGLFLSAVYLQGIIFPLFIRTIGLTWMFINSVLVAIATFICILKLGGIPYSGGLILVGLALVFFTLNFHKKRHSLWIYIIYVGSVILAGVLNPYLTVPPEMTSEVNISLYVINILWISGFAMIFVFNFISQRVRLEKLETDRIKELDEVKTKFYTNITHEFRTPLTVIKGMTELMRNDPESWLAEGSEKIDRNAGVLLNLVNQMLDLSKLESGAMPVRMIRADINLYIKYIVELFQSVAAGRKITLNYTSGIQPYVIDYDPDKLMQIISNLLSNALKFTQPSGHIEVNTSITGDGKYEVRVSDNGAGIPEDFLPHVFDRFSRAEASAGTATPGSGLGLALTKELVKLLDGTITVESVLGEGTEFTVTLPVTYGAPLQEGPGLHELKSRMPHFFIHHERMEKKPEDHKSGGKEKHMLLIVEDNYDVVHYLMTLFSGDFDVIVAANGEEGVGKAIEYVPDIILSDIMMPVMDGIEMLEIVKNDLRTSHIPVVILTAKADVASRLEGLSRGADAYIAKPFNRNELQVQLQSLIKQRKKLQERYASVGHLVLSDEKDYHIEDAFMNRTRALMIANLSNENYDIQTLCHEMSLSRTQLYRKFRSLTDRSPNDYFRTLRLHKAKDLLAGSVITVAEAAYKAGFKNVSHFSRVFTQEFGIKPREIHK
jgi:signal transduction histidine kinase/DNA-binding response OmpR family regulator